MVFGGREKAYKFATWLAFLGAFGEFKRKKRKRVRVSKKVKDSLTKFGWPFDFEEKELCHRLIWFCLRQRRDESGEKVKRVYCFF